MYRGVEIGFSLLTAKPLQFFTTFQSVPDYSGKQQIHRRDAEEPSLCSGSR